MPSLKRPMVSTVLPRLILNLDISERRSQDREPGKQSSSQTHEKSHSEAVLSTDIIRAEWEGDGRGERIRTSGLLVPNQALYQAEPRPDERKAAKPSIYHEVASSALHFDTSFAISPKFSSFSSRL